MYVFGVPFNRTLFSSVRARVRRFIGFIYVLRTYILYSTPLSTVQTQDPREQAQTKDGNALAIRLQLVVPSIASATRPVDNSREISYSS